MDSEYGAAVKPQKGGPVQGQRGGNDQIGAKKLSLSVCFMLRIQFDFASLE